MHVEQDWRCAEVIVPSVVMHSLEVPPQLAGKRIHGNQRSPEQISSGPVPTPVVGSRLPDWHVKNASFRINREQSPDVRARTTFPVVAAPSIASRFTRMRNVVKSPGELASMDVPSAGVAGRAHTRRFLHVCAGDHDVLVNDWRRGEIEKPVLLTIQCEIG